MPGKVLEHNFLSDITQHMQENHAIRPTPHGFRKGRSRFTKLVSFYNKVTHPGDEGKAVDVVSLDLSKAFDTVTHSVLPEKPAAPGLQGWTLHWVKNFSPRSKRQHKRKWPRVAPGDVQIG